MIKASSCDDANLKIYQKTLFLTGRNLRVELLEHYLEIKYAFIFSLLHLIINSFKVLPRVKRSYNSLNHF